MIIKKDKFKRKHLVKVTFRKKGCCKGVTALFFSITNSLRESLKLMFIFRTLNFLQLLGENFYFFTIFIF